MQARRQTNWKQEQETNAQHQQKANKQINKQVANAIKQTGNTHSQANK